MNKKMFVKCMPYVLIAFFLSGCASYRAMPLCNVSETTTYLPFRKDIVIAAKAFDKKDCKKYLDRDVISEGYVPVQLSIENPSDSNFLFSLSRVSLPCANPEEVAEKVHTSTLARTASYGAAAFMFWPFAIPAVVDGIKSAQANEALNQDFSSKTAKDQLISARSHVNMLLFIPIESYQSKFHVTLMDLKSNQLREFTVKAQR